MNEIDEKTGGWIKIHRKWLKNPYLLKSNVFLVWIYLLTKANYKKEEQSFVIFNGKKIELKLGQLLTSTKRINADLCISQSTVWRILQILKNEIQIEIQTCSTSSLITIINWKKYQYDEIQSEKPVKNEWKTNEKPVNTSKNIRREEIEEEKREEPTHTLTPDRLIRRKPQEEKVVDCFIDRSIH